MVQDIDAALDAIVALQETLVIQEPRAVAVKRASKLPLDMSRHIPETPWFQNLWTFDGEVRDISLGEESYVVNMTLYHYRADLSTAHQELLKFHNVIVTEFGKNITLGAVVSNTRLVGRSPTQTVIEHNGRPYAALDYDLIVTMYNDRTTFATGV